MAINVEELTSGSITQNADSQYEWTGTGIFDKLIIAVNGNIKVQYDNGKIKDDKYADVYLGSMQSVIQSAMNYILQKEKIEEETKKLIAETTEVPLNGIKLRLKTEAETDKIISEKTEVPLNGGKQREVLQAQKELYKRQKAGFDDNKQQKILETQMSAWGITFQDTDTTFVPAQLAQSGFDTSFTAVRTDYYDVCDDTCTP